MSRDFTDYNFVSQDIFGTLEKKQFSRKNDSRTSKQAVKPRQISSELMNILAAIKLLGTDFTARELANFSGIDYNLIQKRLSVLARLSLIRKSDENSEDFLMRDGKAVWWLI